jgi:alkanesulfonate monooxygenase SsuD/methylene tetrahydromethanopterin reductase-like flavin-dependent oxidoreductase (luciferase family)
MDFSAMTAEVSDEMIDAIAITGRPDEVRDQLRQWDGLSEQVLLYPPTVGVAHERVSENLDAMVDTFAA